MQIVHIVTKKVTYLNAATLVRIVVSSAIFKSFLLLMLLLFYMNYKKNVK